MAGLLIFANLQAAVAHGFEVVELQGDHYLVRKRLSGRWALAIALRKTEQRRAA